MDPKEKPETSSGGPAPQRLDCIKFFDALWFCYSLFHQMQSYYRYGEFDNCFGKWGDLSVKKKKWGDLGDCLKLKTKRVAEVEEILSDRERARPHIWTYRTVDEASKHWWRIYKHFVILAPAPPKPLGAAAAPPVKSGGGS